MKRVLSFMLVLCMLVAVLPVSTFAATQSYTFNFGDNWDKDGNDVPVGTVSSDGKWKLVAKSTDDNADGNLSAINVKTYVAKNGGQGLRWKHQSATSFAAIQLNGIAAGTYTMTFGVDFNATGGAAANIYVIPAEVFPSADDCAAIRSKLAGMTSVGKIDSVSIASTNILENVVFSGSDSGSYVVVFLATDSLPSEPKWKATMRLKTIALDGTGDVPAATEPAATEPAATEPATQPNENTITFDFTGLVTEGTLAMSEPTSLLYNKVDYGRNWKVSMCQNGPITGYPEYMDYTCVVREGQVQSLQPYRWFIMFTLYGIEPGMYTVDVNLVANDDAATTFPAELYFMPQSEMTHINTSGPMGKMNAMEPVATFNSGSATNTVKNLQFSDDPDGTYYVMINADHLQNDLQGTRIQLKSIVLTKSEKAPAPTTAPTIPDFNTSEEPVDDADSGSFPVVPVVIGVVAAIAVAAVVVIVIGKKKKNSAE